MPIVLPLMIGAWIAAMVTIKMIIAPAIYESAGWIGAVITVLALLAVGLRLER